MCRFHSFVVTHALDFLEKPGESHHSCIASPSVVDRALLPEFDVRSRRVHFDGAPLKVRITRLIGRISSEFPLRPQVARAFKANQLP